MSPFNPLAERARWRIIYEDLIQTSPIDRLISYDTMGEALQLDPETDRHAIQMAVRRASKESEEHDDRALEVIPNKGYRIVQPGEHIRLAQGHQQRSRKALVRGHSKVVHVDFTGMEPETRKAFEVVAQAFSMQIEMTRRLDVRQRHLEKAVGAIQEQSTRSATEITALKERLDRLENGDASLTT